MALNPSKLYHGLQEIFNAVFDSGSRALQVTLQTLIAGEDTTNNRLVIEKFPVTLAASAILNAAGSATLLAASAGTVYNITHYMVNTGGAGRFGLKIGGRKFTPFGFMAANTTNEAPLGNVFKSAANEAVKVSASAGSARTAVHYYKTTS